MEALKLMSEAALKAELDPGTSADRCQVVVHVDQQVLEDPSQPGQSALEGGIGVSAETSRRIACDGSEGKAQWGGVTVPELLSPANKRSGTGRRIYLDKRELILSTRTSPVELDLHVSGHGPHEISPLGWDGAVRLSPGEGSRARVFTADIMLVENFYWPDETN